ncbi:MAG: domain S-box-containing protein [Chitinophagaceae bacterium]|nr:domain S-box-containing protein [Chitinophagaceae bacterium]
MEHTSDELSHALQQMQDNLKRVAVEHAERIQLQGGKNTLNEKLRGDKTLPELSREIIDFLVSYSAAQIGTLYVFEDGRLRLQYCYGLTGEANDTIQPGEGLIGQAALEKTLKVIDKIPGNYFKIKSSAGKEKPDTIAILPAVFNKNTIGVIELAKFGDFSPVQLKLFDEISEPVALAINTILGKQSLEGLLTLLNVKEQELSSRILAINKSNASIEFDLNGNIIGANDIFLDIVGYTEDEIIGKHHSIFVEKGYETTRTYREFWNHLKKGEYQQGEFKRLHKNGNPVWIQGNYNPILNVSGKPVRILKIATDITAAKKQRQEIEAITTAIYKSNAVIEFDLSGTILNANDTFLDIFGYTEKEIIGKHHSIFIEKEYKASKAYQEFWDRLRDGEYQQDEFKRVTKSGEFVWIKGNYNPILDLQGEPYKILKIATDVTLSRKQAMELAAQSEELEAQQEELKQFNEELQEKTGLLEKSEAELRSQQEELQQSNEELEDKASLLEDQKERLENAKMDIENKARELELTGRYKSEFLANMSHELRTPLNSILLLAQLLSENKNKSLGDKEVDHAKNIYNSGADLLNLINEVLDLAKVESGRMELDFVKISMTEIHSAIISMFSEIAKNKSIDFTVSYNENEIKTLTTDKQRLAQILRNLLSNAFKFTEKGGQVKLSIQKAALDIPFKNARLERSPEIVVFSVTDTGIGIPDDKQAIVFEAFQQADGSTKRKYGGTGLGLSISRELASVLGGEIHLKSEEGTGSTFSLYLPLNFDADTRVLAERRVEIQAKKNDDSLKQKNRIEKLPVTEKEIEDDRYNIYENDKVILIMEDDLEFSRILLDFVRERNYKGIVTAQGNSGLSHAREYKPDAILLDMKLPVMDGAEVLRHVKNDPALRHIPVQVISGYDRKKEGMQLGAFDFIRKPVGKGELKNAFDKNEGFVSKKIKKLLVVEDNESQSRAIRELIGNGDVKFFSAFSGKEAYEMMVREQFDCVIVDLGLPDMSGLDLLEKVKGSEQLSNIPIIVYTAKDLTRDEHARLLRVANTVVLKTVDSHERLLDETMLFLHRVESRLPKEKQNMIRKLHRNDEVLKNRRVLIVDDDIRNIYSITNVLEEEGMNCLTAEDGRLAIKMLKEDPAIEIVLMDVMMPDMDGYETTKEIRGTTKFNKLPIIALTAKAMKGDREKCLTAGMSDYIAKPVNIDQLLSLLRVWLYR